MRNETKSKICVTSQGNNLDAQIDPRFGRCQYFIIVDPETMKFEAVENPSINAMGGAGIQSAQLIANKGVEIILTGNVGPNAFQTLQAAGLKIVTGMVGSVKEVIEKYKKGEITTVVGPTVPGHFGTQGVPPVATGIGTQRVSEEQELEVLKQQTQSLKQGMEQIAKRIDELSKKKSG